MFSNIRWRIALWFIGLSTAAYIVPTGLALVMFYSSLTAAIDHDLDVFMASFGHAIEVIDGKPVFRNWARVVQTHPAHSLVTYQLFDRNGKLLDEHFPPGIPTLFRNRHEVTHNGLSMRIGMTALKEGQATIGYLQVQLPTKSRDDAMRELAIITAMVAPVVLFGLGWSSYLVSEKATAQIRQTNAMLRRFIADASHELYTPLSIVQAANESIARQLERLGMGSSEFQISESTLERMEKMLEDLMLLSTMENPAPRAINDTISVVSLVESVVNEFRPKFEQKGVAISLLINGHGSIRGDQTALHRMFVNVIENALRYTDASGAVQIHVIKEGHCLRISVSDTGIGIPDECLPHIFDRFYRVDASRSRSSGGSGLGLPIALAIAQVHHGKIDAQSKADTGSTFCITLPVDENH